MQHISSAQNETSAQQTGEKNKATKFNVNQNRLQIGILKNIIYGIMMELGTKYIKAKHDLQIALNKNKDLIVDDVKVRVKSIFDNSEYLLYQVNKDIQNMSLKVDEFKNLMTKQDSTILKTFWFITH